MQFARTRGRTGTGISYGRGITRDMAFVKTAARNNTATVFKFSASSTSHGSKTFQRPVATALYSSTSSVRGRGRSIGIPSSTSSAQLPSSRSVKTTSTTSTTTPTSADGKDSCFLLAITTGRGQARCEIGMAAVDLNIPHLIFSQFSDNQRYTNTLTKIYKIDPAEVLILDTICNPQSSNFNLYSLIREKFPGLPITPVPRTHFNNNLGYERICTLCAKIYLGVKEIAREKPYALAAVAALMKYVEFIQHVTYLPYSVKVEFQGSENTVAMDLETIQSLELVSSRSPDPRMSLLESLNRCVTRMGRKRLRNLILEPPYDEEIISQRQSCVAELVENRSLHTSLLSIVHKFHSADRLLNVPPRSASQESNIVGAERNLNYILLLKNTLEATDDLQSTLKIGRHAFFKKVIQTLEDSRYREISNKIVEVVNSDAKAVSGFSTAMMERCFAIKSGVNEMMDVLRKTYCEIIEDMSVMVEDLGKKYNRILELRCNRTMGYHIQMIVPKSVQFDITNLPSEFKHVNRRGKTIFMTTESLIIENLRVRDAANEIYDMSNVILAQVVDFIRDRMDCLFQICADIAELDTIMSLAHISCLPDYTRPEFGSELELKDSKHPILDIMGIEMPVANDVNASFGKNFHVITGPNMSGKSVYLKQIVLIQIMAQIGSYVPASKATVRMSDRICCRTAAGDSQCDSSTFVGEIKQVEYILQTITPTSLIVMDEFCRSTTVEEGTSIAWAVCDELLRSEAFTFCATHFLYLTKLAELHHNVQNLHFEITTTAHEGASRQQMIYSHKIKPGVTSSVFYGISLAEISGLPKSVLLRTRKFAEEIAANMKSTEEEPSTEKEKSLKLYENLGYLCAVEIYKLLQRNQFNAQSVGKIVKERNLLELRDEFMADNDTNTYVSAISTPNSPEEYTKLLNDRKQVPEKLGETKPEDIFKVPAPVPGKKRALKSSDSPTSSDSLPESNFHPQSDEKLPSGSSPETRAAKVPRYVNQTMLGNSEFQLNSILELNEMKTGAKKLWKQSDTSNNGAKTSSSSQSNGTEENKNNSDWKSWLHSRAGFPSTVSETIISPGLTLLKANEDCRNFNRIFPNTGTRGGNAKFSLASDLGQLQSISVAVNREEYAHNRNLNEDLLTDDPNAPENSKKEYPNLFDKLFPSSSDLSGESFQLKLSNSQNIESDKLIFSPRKDQAENDRISSFSMVAEDFENSPILSESSLAARQRAIEKEIEIFRMIEGDDFDVGVLEGNNLDSNLSIDSNLSMDSNLSEALELEVLENMEIDEIENLG